MLLNFDKLKSVNCFKVRLSEKSFEMFFQNACAYFSALENDINRVNPNEVMCVISVLTDFKEYFEREADWERLTLHALNILQKGVYRSVYDKIASFLGMTHVAYVTHDLALRTPKIKPFHDGINKILIENLTDFLKASNDDEFYRDSNYEVINGLSGPLSYLLYANDDRMREMVDQIVDVFIKRSKDIKILDYRLPGWHYYPSAIEQSYMPVEAKNGIVNYGLSHGMAAPLVTLSLAYKNGMRKDGMLEAIDELISEFMKAYYYVDDIAYWPGKILFEQYVGLEEMQVESSQMSWCYGSVGILRSLYMSGSLMSNSKIEQFALEEFNKIAEMSLSDYKLVQMIVCHGFVGTAAILNAMYLDTGNEQFHHKTIEMIEDCAILDIERFFENERTLAQTRNRTTRASLHNHLEGYCGIIQTILSILKGIPTGNEKRLLIM